MKREEIVGLALAGLSITLLIVGVGLSVSRDKDRECVIQTQELRIDQLESELERVREARVK